jgi:carbonic anhydrase
MSTLQYAIEHLKVDHIIVMGHTKCGGIKAAIACEPLGLIDQWLQHIREVAVKHKKVYKLSWVQKAMIQRKIGIHGWVCDIETGIIKELALSIDEWDEIESYFKYDF